MVDDASRVTVAGPLAPLAAGFAGYLASAGYTPGSVIRHLRLMAQASRWLAAIDAGREAMAAVGADVFLAWRADNGHRRVTAKMLRPLLDYLQLPADGPAARADLAPRPEADLVLGRYREYLITVRGVAPGTVRNRECVIRTFLAGIAAGDGGRLRLDRLRAADVQEFLLAEAARRRGGGPQCGAPGMGDCLGVKVPWRKGWC